MHKRNCMECALGEMCSARNLRECIEYLAQYGEVDDDMMDKYIESRREEFRKEWFAYVGEDCE